MIARKQITILFCLRMVGKELLQQLNESHKNTKKQLEEINFTDYCNKSLQKNYDKKFFDENKEWWTPLYASLKEAVVTNSSLSIDKWLMDQCKKFNIIEPSQEIKEVNEIKKSMNNQTIKLDCFRFVNLLLKDWLNKDDTLKESSNLMESIKWTKEKEFFIQNKLEEYSNLQLGDIVIYLSQDIRELKHMKHIAIYIGKKNGVEYVMSKFGSSELFLHPVDSVPDIYGFPKRYRNLQFLSPESKRLLKSIYISFIDANPNSAKTPSIKNKKMAFFFNDKIIWEKEVKNCLNNNLPRTDDNPRRFPPGMTELCLIAYTRDPSIRM